MCTTTDGIERRAFIVTWLVGVCDELRTNSRNFLPFRKPSLANHLFEPLFPTNEIIDLYIQPLTSFSENEQPPDATEWVPVEPDLEKITSIAVDHLSWSDPAELSQTFYNNLWEALNH